MLFTLSKETCDGVCRFGSWTYSSNIVDIDYYQEDAVYVETYMAACPSVVQSHQSTRNVHYYECCPDEPYTDVTISLSLAWR